MNLSNLQTLTTVEFSEKYQSDSVTIDGQKNLSEVNRVIKHLDRIRNLASSPLHAKIVSENYSSSKINLPVQSVGKKSPFLAGLMSLVVPGAGEVYAGWGWP